MKKAVFWDFDGTLVYNTGSLWSTCVLEALQQYMPDCGVTLDMIRPYMKSGFPWHTPQQDFTRLLGKKFWTFMFLRFQQIFYCLGVPQEIGNAASRSVRELVLQPSRYHLFQDTIAVLKEVQKKGYENDIISNNYPELEEMLQALGLSPYIRHCIVSAKVGYDKPRREIFDIARNAAGDPARCIMVGDNPEADIAGAKNAGMETILVHAKYSSDIVADHTCTTLEEVAKLL